MKYAIVFLEGLADLPVVELENQTPLERAATPVLDALAEEGVVGRVELLRSAPPAGIEAALFSVLGGDAHRDLPGRGAFEAFASGQPPGGQGRVAAAQLVTQVDGRLTDLTGGGLRDAEAKLLLRNLNEALGAPGFELIHLAGNQSLLLLGNAGGEIPLTTPPEFCLGRGLAEHLPRGAGGERLSALVRASGEILEKDPVNRVRCDLGENPANMLWVYGVADVPFGRRWLEVRNCKGALASQDRWAAGMALAFGLDPLGGGGGVVEDPAALGSEVAAAVDRFDLVVAHLAAPGRAGLAQEPERKMRCIEEMDAEVIGPLRDRLRNGEGRLAVVSAWTSSSREGIVRPGINPFVVWGRGAEGGVLGRGFSEASAQGSRLEVRGGEQFREYFFSDR